MEVAVAATRNVVLSQHQHELAESLVASGRYQNASEVLREGLRLLEQQETEDAAKLVALREATDKGWKDLTSGGYDEIADDNLDDFGLVLDQRQPPVCPVDLVEPQPFDSSHTALPYSWMKYGYPPV
jgi:antitoxin ParD1/3/4